MICYILWDQSAELFSLGQFTLRWNGLLLILAFLIARQVLVYIHKKEGKPIKDVDILATWLILAGLLGARLGNVIFYQPQLLSRPLAIFFPFEFKPSFHLTAMNGFSSHGAALAVLVALWFYSRKKKPGQRYFQVLDRISIVSAWIAVPILIGSFLNSDMEGKPTDSAIGTVFIKPVTRGILQLSCCIMRIPGGKNPVSQVIAKKSKDVAKRENGHHSIALYFFFKPGTTVQTVDEFLLGDVKTYLYDMSQVVSEPGTEPLHYAVFSEPTADFEARIRTIGVARYPVQLFESVSCLLLFALSFAYWNKYKSDLPEGRIFGFCMTILWSLRFVYEYLKENQATFIEGMGLNRSQVLCIPLILIGIVVWVRSYRSPVLDSLQ